MKQSIQIHSPLSLTKPHSELLSVLSFPDSVFLSALLSHIQQGVTWKAAQDVPGELARQPGKARARRSEVDARSRKEERKGSIDTKIRI